MGHGRRMKGWMMTAAWGNRQTTGELFRWCRQRGNSVMVPEDMWGLHYAVGTSYAGYAQD
jgi:hypothetical protein